MTTSAVFVTLGANDCRALLERNHIGRLAFTTDNSVDIEPLGYVHIGDWIFLRSAQGSKFEWLAHRPYVAFEVDEVAGPFDWSSVVVHGSVHLLPKDGSPIERREYLRAVAALGQIMPDAFTRSDPVPDRDVVYGVHIQQLTGRAARSSR